MSHYTVIWKIDIRADDPVEAAITALTIQRDPQSIATVFDVYDHDGGHHSVDLEEYHD